VQWWAGEWQQEERTVRAPDKVNKQSKAVADRQRTCHRQPTCWCSTSEPIAKVLTQAFAATSQS
jgi:hypothetical protein